MHYDKEAGQVVTETGRGAPTERAAARGSAETAQAPIPYLETVCEHVVRVLLGHSAFLDEIAARITDRLGLIPTAHEIAKAVREEGGGPVVPAAADRIEGHPVNPEDGLS